MTDTEAPKDRAAQLAEKAAGRPESDQAPGKFSRSTWVALIVGAAGVGIALLLVAVGLGPYTGLAWLAAAVMGVVTVAGLLKLTSEALHGAPSDRPTPEKALRAYFAAVEQQRWDAAGSCLSWVAKSGDETVRPAMPDIDLAEARFRISGDRDLAAYWADFVGAFKARGNRTMVCKVLSAQSPSPTVAYVTVEMRISLDLRTADLGGQARQRRDLLSSVTTVSCSGRWPVYRRGDLWYLLTAGIPEDARVKRA